MKRQGNVDRLSCINNKLPPTCTNIYIYKYIYIYNYIYIYITSILFDITYIIQQCAGLTLMNGRNNIHVFELLCTELIN